MFATLSQVESTPSCIQEQVPSNHVVQRGNTCSSQFPSFCLSTLSRTLDRWHKTRWDQSISTKLSWTNGLCQPYIKMLDLTALLTKDRIEPLALPELFAGAADAAGKPSCRFAQASGMIHSSMLVGIASRPLKRWRCGQLRREGRHLLTRMAL